MNKSNLKNRIILSFIFTISFSLFLSCFETRASDNSELKNDEPYQFQIVPGTDAWQALKYHDEKVKALQIPENDIDTLSTGSLIETCLNFPVVYEILAYNSIQQGFEIFCETYNCFNELINREDAGRLLLKKYKEMNPDHIVKGDNTLISKFFIIEVLLSQDRIIRSVTSEQKKELVKQGLKNIRFKTNNPETFGFLGLVPCAAIMKQGTKDNDDSPSLKADASVHNPQEFEDVYSGINKQNIDSIIQKADRFIK